MNVRRRSVARTTLLGMATGAGYGVALRTWMRLVSSEPEFSWRGTGYIVGVFALLGTTAGLTTAGRRHGWTASLFAVRAVGIALSLGCFVAAGAAMLPTIVPAALGRGRSDWPRWLRAALITTGAGAAVGLSLFVTLSELPIRRQVLGLALYLALCAVEVEMTARLYAPSRPRTPFAGQPGAGDDDRSRPRLPSIDAASMPGPAGGS
jgi:hypothetical protein